MNALPPDLRERLRAWTDRPPRLDAAIAGARARAGASQRRPTARRLALAVSLGAALVAVALLVTARGDRPAQPPPIASRTPPPVESRLVVIELSSGTPLYVVLPPPAARRSS
jgi:hypothetical protein